VVVIGGGDTAMDAARTAHRLTGRPVTILYRRTRHEMPAAEEELDGALEEGNLLEELVAPVEVLRDGDRVSGLRCVRNALGDPGPDGRRSPVPIPDSDFIVPCDTVVVAVGQLPDLTFLDGSRVTRHSGGGVVIDGATRSAGPDGVYAGGDVVVEPGSIISACADGRRAAEAICDRLGVAFDEPPSRRPVLSDGDILEAKATRARRIAQVKPAVLPVRDRRDFALIESTLAERGARIEALRCVQCTAFCDKCVEVCPNRANYTFAIEPMHWSLPVFSAAGDTVHVIAMKAFRIAQARQILHVDDFCNECDNCQTFCVHHGKPYLDKPRLFLDAGLFAAEQNNAFRIESRTIRRRERGEECRLTVGGTALVYEDAAMRVVLTRDWQVREATARTPFDGARSLVPAAEMAVLFEGITSRLPFLLEAT